MSDDLQALNKELEDKLKLASLEKKKKEQKLTRQCKELARSLKELTTAENRCQET